MMTAQEKERYDTLVDTIRECLRILQEDLGTSFILAISTAEDDDTSLVNTGCNCTFKEALVMFNDLAEGDSKIAKAMGMIAMYTKLKKE